MKRNLRDALADGLLQQAAVLDNLMVFTSDATGSANLHSFVEEYPEKFVQVGIAEQNEVAVASGITNQGFVSFVCAPAAFLSARALEQIKIDAAYNHSNIKIIGISGGLAYGTQGPTHMAVSDVAAIMPLEDITVLLPSDYNQMRYLVKVASETEGAFYIRVGRNGVPELYPKDEKFDIGKAKQLCSGSDATVISCGEIVSEAVEAARLLALEGINVRVLDMFSLRPLDEEAVLNAAAETGRIVVAEEHTVYGGLGAEVAQLVSEHCPVKVKCLGIPSTHCYSGDDSTLKAHYGLDRNGIYRTVLEILK